jgi:hypothetical protein
MEEFPYNVGCRMGINLPQRVLNSKKKEPLFSAVILPYRQHKGCGNEANEKASLNAT